MKIIIAGTRTIENYSLVQHAVKISKYEITEVVSGKARGVDKLGERYAKENDIHIEPFPADWNKYKKAAGYIRNKQMAEYADALILIWTGDIKKSPGSYNMLNIMKEMRKPFCDFELPNDKHNGQFTRFDGVSNEYEVFLTPKKPIEHITINSLLDGLE